MQMELNCSFCHKECGVQSDVIKHWNEVHYTTKQYPRMPRNKQNEYICLVCDLQNDYSRIKK